MPKKIMLALSNAEGDCDKPIHCEDLDKMLQGRGFEGIPGQNFIKMVMRQNTKDI